MNGLNPGWNENVTTNQTGRLLLQGNKNSFEEAALMVDWGWLKCSNASQSGR
jgi:hypothetical protein